MHYINVRTSHCFDHFFRTFHLFVWFHENQMNSRWAKCKWILLNPSPDVCFHCGIINGRLNKDIINIIIINYDDTDHRFGDDRQINLCGNWWTLLNQLNRLNWLILEFDSAVFADIRCAQISHTRNDVSTLFRQNLHSCNDHIKYECVADFTALLYWRKKTWHLLHANRICKTGSMITLADVCHYVVSDGWAHACHTACRTRPQWHQSQNEYVANMC